MVAFRANYTKLFLNALEKTSTELNPEIQVDFDNEGKLMINEAE